MIKVMCRETCTYAIPEWVEIRKLSTKADYEAYRRIYLDAFGDTLRNRVYLFLAIKHIYQCGYVWLYKGDYIGIYSLIAEEEMRFTPGVQFRVIYNFAVAPTVRGKGFSRVMLADAITEASNLGCKEILLSVKADNVPALNLYEKLGFKTIK